MFSIIQFHLQQFIIFKCLYPNNFSIYPANKVLLSCQSRTFCRILHIDSYIRLFIPFGSIHFLIAYLLAMMFTDTYLSYFNVFNHLNFITNNLIFLIAYFHIILLFALPVSGMSFIMMSHFLPKQDI